ncbi:TetR/AcrR family transcriptional regulator [Acetobacter malorum]|uniref:TetR/AcrR family transcriptional regulator n=1 Tax=Acetobacter malorum TaxID=178901 RepID=UPI0007776B92|nr:TetR/AcrR family transcriptional regulator [Acetobacter malorum]
MSNAKEAARLSPDNRCEQILGVARIHFAREDQDAVSIQSIANDAGVARALVYHYFPGRDALLSAVLQREAEGLLAATAPRDGFTPYENLEHALGAYLDHVASCTGRLRELYMPRPAMASLVADLVTRNHATQVERILSQLPAEHDSPVTRLGIAGWLGFVVAAARQSETHSGISRSEIIQLCLHALSGATGIGLDQLREAPASRQLHQKETCR